MENWRACINDVGDLWLVWCQSQNCVLRGIRFLVELEHQAVAGLTSLKIQIVNGEEAELMLWWTRSYKASWDHHMITSQNHKRKTKKSNGKGLHQWHKPEKNIPLQQRTVLQDTTRAAICGGEWMQHSCGSEERGCKKKLPVGLACVRLGFIWA